MWSSRLCTVDGGVRCFFFLRGGFLGSAGCLAASLTCSQSRNTVHHLLSLWQKTLHSNLRRKDLFDLVISEVSFHGHLALLLLTLSIAEHKFWLGGRWGRAKRLASRWAGGRERDTRKEGRRKHPSKACFHPQWRTSPNRAHFLFSTPAKMQFYYYTIKGSIHWLG